MMTMMIMIMRMMVMETPTISPVFKDPGPVKYPTFSV